MDADPWDPRWGPWGRPTGSFVRSRLKRTIASLVALGRSPADAARGLVVLSYHGTENDRKHPWWIDFHGQIRLIEDLGYRVVPLARLVELLRRGEVIPQPTMAITFDDGWANNLELAFPELARRGWPATVFITTSFLGRRPFLSTDDLMRLRELGIDIGNHTHRHLDLLGLSREQVDQEISECNRRLEALAGITPRHFCYPFGRYNSRVRQAVIHCGMEAACSGRVGCNPIGGDPYVLRRLTIDSGDGPRELRLRLAGGFDFLDRSQRHMDTTPVRHPGESSRKA